MIRTVDLGMTYQPESGPLEVFAGLNLEIQAGESVALVGESGAGKSTLLHLLGGLDRPTQGRVLVDGQDLAALGPAALARFRNEKLGFVWQRPSLLPEFSLLENLAMPLLIRGIRRAEALAAAREGLEEVELDGRAGNRAGELSGGEQQRAAVARALIGRPRILLADEPTGSLDPATAGRIADLVFRLHQTRKLTSVIVTHSHLLAERCERILTVVPGAPVPMVGRRPRES
jgi:lipoprotein-releasing system ATP-binding protein